MNSKTNNQFLNEKVINIKELCWRLFEQWRMIVIFTILVTAIFLGYTHLQNTRASKKNVQQDAQELSAEEIINALPEKNKAVVAGAYRLLLEREQLAQYIQSTPFMQLDPSRVERLRLSWSVIADERIQKSLIQAYATTFQSNECINTIIKCCNDQLNSAQVSDLISVTFPSEKGQEAICCDVYLTDSVDVELLQEKLRQIISNDFTRLQKEFGPHQVVDLRSEVAIVSDETVLQKQTLVLNSFANSNNQINSLKTTFSSEQRDAFSRLEALNNGQKATVQDDTPQKTLTVHSVLLGIILGFILYLFGFFLHVIVTKKVLYADEIPDSSLRRLGEWYSDCSDLNGIRALMKDRLITKRHYRMHLNKAEEIEKASNAINKICKYNGIKRVLFVSTNVTVKEQQEFITTLAMRCALTNTDANCAEINQKNYDNESSLTEVDGVVLFLIKGCTTYKDIDYLYNRCNDYNKPIIGTVFLG